jgi:hypothetical protein
LAIGKSHEGRHAGSLRVAMKWCWAWEEGTSPIVSEWDGSEIPRRRSEKGPHAGERLKATAPR